MIVDERYQAAEVLFKEVKERFPEVELAGIGPSPESDDLTVVKVVLPDDELEEALSEFTGERATEILLETGDYIIVVSGLYEVWIEFEVSPSPDERRLIYYELDRLLQSHGMGEMGAWVGPLLTIQCFLRSLDFARNEVVALLDRLGALDRVEITWEHPYRSSLYPNRTRLYPPEVEN